MSKPIRRSDGKVLGDGKDSDEALLERMLPKVPEPPKTDWSKQITRNGEPVSERGREIQASLNQEAVQEKTWEEYREELLADLEHRSSERILDTSDDIDCDADPRKYFSK